MADLHVYSCVDDAMMPEEMIAKATKGLCDSCGELIPLRANGEIETHFGVPWRQCGGTGQSPRKDQVPIPLPPEPPRDRVVEALDADGRVCKRFTKVQKYWVCELGAGWLWRELLSTSIKQSWSLRHVAAAGSGEQA